MRRKGGTGLVRNEMQVLAASLRLAIEGNGETYGYELFKTLSAWEGKPVMNPGTLYRCLRGLEARDLYRTQIWPGPSGPPRVAYTLTGIGVEAARMSTLQLAATPPVPCWVDLAHALPSAYPLLF